MTKPPVKRAGAVPATTIPFGPLKIDAVALGSQGNAVLGIRDSGKTYTATLLAEGLWSAGIPFTTFDPIGVWRFMRVPGRGRGYPVVVAGGVDGDLPLTVASAPAIVEAAMANGVSLVIDLYSMGLSKADWRRIVESCLEVMLHKNQTLRHVFLEEAAEFAPQRIGPESGRVYAAVEKLARMGGNARLGYTLINQRAEEVNKAVLELCDNLFLHRQKGRNSLTALSKWLDIGNVSDHREIIQTMPTLATGECWAWLEGTDRPVHIKVPAKNSLHPDRRVVRGDQDVKLAAKTDVGKFVESMRASLGAAEADARANDPRALQAEVRRLQAALRAAEAGSGGVGPAELRAAVDAALDAGYARGAEVARHDAFTEAANRTARVLEALVAGLRKEAGEAPEIVTLEALKVPARPVAKPATQPATTERAPTPVPSAGSDTAITGPQQKVLDAIGWWEAFGIMEPTVNQVGFIAGYSPSGGAFANLRGGLRSAGLLTYPAGGKVALTDGGRAAAAIPSTLPTVEDLQDAVRAKLTAPQVKVLNAVLAAYPHAISSTEVAAEAGYEAKGGAFANLRGSLRTLEIIDYPSPGMVVARDWLFPVA